RCDGHRSALSILLAFLLDLRKNNQRWRSYRKVLLLENKWRAQRYGIDAELADFGRRATVPFAELTDEMVEFFRAHAQGLECLKEVEHAATIARRGTSADHQLAVYNKAITAGADEREAQVEVVDWLIAQTMHEEMLPAAA
ncbi:MAG: carboxylate-amine ligase, partial [Pseudomonadota bacterium]